MNKWTEKLIDWIFAICGIVGAGFFVALFGDIAKMATKFPGPLTSVCVLCFLAGFSVSYAFGICSVIVERARKKREQREMERQNQIDRAEREAQRRHQARKTIRELQWADKNAIKELAQKEPVDIEDVPDNVIDSYIKNGSDIFTMYEIGNGIWRVKLTEYGRYAVSVSSDILDEVLPPEDSDDDNE